MSMASAVSWKREASMICMIGAIKAIKAMKVKSKNISILGHIKQFEQRSNICFLTPRPQRYECKIAYKLSILLKSIKKRQ